MLASHAAKRHGQHLPPIRLPPVDFGNRKRVRYLIASHHSHESNAIPQDGSVVKNFYDNFVDIGVLVVDAPASDDLDLRVLPPGAAHVNKPCLVVEECSKSVCVLLCHPAPLHPRKIQYFLFGVRTPRRGSTLSRCRCGVDQYEGGEHDEYRLHGYHNLSGKETRTAGLQCVRLRL